MRKSSSDLSQARITWHRCLTQECQTTNANKTPGECNIGSKHCRGWEEEGNVLLLLQRDCSLSMGPNPSSFEGPYPPSLPTPLCFWGFSLWEPHWPQSIGCHFVSQRKQRLSISWALLAPMLPCSLSGWNCISPCCPMLGNGVDDWLNNILQANSCQHVMSL